MNTLPTSENLAIEKIATIFRNTTNSYKYLWFLAILESLKNPTCSEKIDVNELAIKMIAKVWFPINVYRLSFGKQDSFAKYIKDLIALNPFLEHYKTAELEKWLLANLKDKNVAIVVKELLKYVPYRFLSGFFVDKLVGVIDSEKNNLIVKFTEIDFWNKENLPIYKFSMDKKAIILQPLWLEYLQKHLAILIDFCQWNLLLYLQKNNPNVPNISGKLAAETSRDLKNGKLFWKNALTQITDFQCIYSQKVIEVNKMSIDHFLPWSYLGHDCLWNLLPTIASVNSSKSDNLPDLSLYLNPFLELQYRAFHVNFTLGNEKLLEDYYFLFSRELSEIQQLPQIDFCNSLKDNILPMYQIAKNMGFTANWIYKP